MGEVKEALRYYREHFFKICLIGITLLLPLQFLLFLLKSYFYLFYGDPDVVFVADLYNGIFMLTGIAVFSLPFIQLAKSSFLEEEVTLGKLYEAFFQYLFPVYVMGFLYAFPYFIFGSSYRSKLI